MTPELRSQRWVPITTVALLGVAATVFAAIGITPWPAVAMLWALLLLTIGQATSWAFAAAAASLTMLAGAAVLIQVSPATGASLAVVSTITLGVGIAALTATGAARPIRLPGHTAVLVGSAAAAIPAIVMLAATIAGMLGRFGYSWAMHNDAVWNLVVARFVIDDGGVRSDLHSNPSPMSPGVIAIAASIGRATTPAAQLLAHDVSRAAELWLVLAMLGSLLAGLICASACRALPIRARAVLTVLGSAVPLGWFAFGNALAFGFYNSTIALTLLLAVWLLWAEGRRSPLATLGFLAMALIALLATWGPLAIVVVLLMALAFALVIRARRHLRLPGALVAAGAALLAIAYGVLVTLPDLRRQAGALAADGGIFDLSPMRSALLVGGLSVVLVAAAIVTRQRRTLLGVVALLASAGVGVGYLLVQRSGDAARLWGYYPTKFTWLIVSLMLVLAVAGLGAFAATVRLRRRGLPAVAAGVGVIGILLLALGGIPPASLPVVDIIRGNQGIAASDDAARVLFEIAEPGRVTIATRLSGADDDRFMNHWLLQLQAVDDEDPIRWWAYFLDPESDEDVCSAAADATDPVVAVTTDASLVEHLKCTTSLEVLVRESLPR